MKRFCLTILFAGYYFFMPFVLSNCSSVDIPYALDGSVSAEVDTDDDALVECQKMEFLVTSCIDILQAESERLATEQAQVEAAAIEVEDFETCQAEENISGDDEEDTTVVDASETDDTETVVVVDCAAVISNLVSAYQVCDGLIVSNKYDACDDIETAVDDVVQLCDDSNIDVTEDFCNSLTA